MSTKSQLPNADLLLIPIYESPQENLPFATAKPESKSGPGPALVFPKRPVPEEVPHFTLKEAFTYSDDPSQTALNQEKAARAFMFVLEWASELAGLLAHGENEQ